MLFVAVAAASDDVAAASARTAKVARLAALLRELLAGRGRASPCRGCPVSSPQRQIGVGWASLRGELPPPAAERHASRSTRSRTTFTRIGAVTGAGSQRERRELLDGLFAAATERSRPS